MPARRQCSDDLLRPLDRPAASEELQDDADQGDCQDDADRGGGTMRFHVGQLLFAPSQHERAEQVST
jgi:hypothetical protein